MFTALRRFVRWGGAIVAVVMGLSLAASAQYAWDSFTGAEGILGTSQLYGEGHTSDSGHEWIRITGNSGHCLQGDGTVRTYGTIKPITYMDWSGSDYRVTVDVTKVAFDIDASPIVAVRASASSEATRTAYFVLLVHNGQVIIFRVVNGTVTTLNSSGNVGAWCDGNLGIEVEGTTIRALWNGQVVSTASDSQISSGHPGIGAGWRNLSFKDWSAVYSNFIVSAPGGVTTTTAGTTTTTTTTTTSTTTTTLHVSVTPGETAYIELQATQQLDSTVSVADGNYKWAKVSGPGEVSFAPSDEASNPTFSANTVGTYVVKLTYTKDGAIAEDTSGNIVVFELSVSASQNYILAGTGGDAARESVITATLNPASCTGQVSFTIAPGTGQGKDCPATVSAATAALNNGTASSTLSSSDVVERVDVNVAFSGVTKTISVWCDMPNCSWYFSPAYLEPESTTALSAELTFTDNPVGNRSVSFVVKQVLLNSGEVTTDNLSTYATFDNPGPVISDASGNVSATLRAGQNLADCSAVEVAIVHETVWVVSEE